jgi:alpha-mannosidase II
MWSEISYLSKWWDIIDIPKKEAVKRFVLKFFEIW